MIYTFPGQLDLSTHPPDLHQGLVMLLVDGARDADGIVAASPMTADLTREILLELRVSGVLATQQETAPAADMPNPPELDPALAPTPPPPSPTPPPNRGVWINPKRLKKKEEEEARQAARDAYLSWPIFESDLKHPPQEFLSAVPSLTGEVDPGEITGDASEYYLLSRIDGATSVESLQSLTSMSMPLVVRRLVKHTASGAISFPEDVRGKFLATSNGAGGTAGAAASAAAESETAASTGQAPGADLIVEVARVVEARLVDDPSVSGPLRRTGAALPPGGFAASDLTQRECLVLSLVQGESSMGELASRGPGDSRDLLITMLDLYRRGCLVLTPPERAPRPKARPPASPRVATPTPAAEPADDTMELEFTTGEFSAAAFKAMLEGDGGGDEGGQTFEEIEATPTPPPRQPTPQPRQTAPATFDDRALESRSESTDEMFALPDVLFRGKDLPGYERSWGNPPAKGDLADVPFDKIFGHVGAGGLTGILHVRRGKEQRNVWFAKGTPVYATSTEAEDRLGSLLWKSGTFNKETYLEFERACRKEPEREAWEVLEEMLLVLPDELLDGRRHQLVHIVARLFHANNGQYIYVGKERLQSDLAMLSVEVEDVLAMVPEVSPRSVTAQLDSGPVATHPAAAPVASQPQPAAAAPPPAAAAATEKRQHPKNPSDWINEHLDMYVLVTDEAAEKLRDLRLGEKERRFVDAITESRHRLRELMPMSSLGRSKTHQFLTALWSKNLFDFADEMDREDEALRNLDTLNKWLVRMETGDLFHAIGTHVSATLRDVQTSYAKERARFDPGKFTDRERPYQETIARINLVMSRAFEVLKDTPKRRMYRAQEFGDSRLRTFAEVQAKKAGVFFFFKQEWEQARHLFESAWDLEPDSAEYLAHMGYCHFKAHPTSKERARGVQMVERAITAAADKEVRVLLTATALEKDRKNSTRQREYMARARKLVNSDEEFRKLLTSYRLTESS